MHNGGKSTSGRAVKIGTPTSNKTTATRAPTASTAPFSARTPSSFVRPPLSTRRITAIGPFPSPNVVITADDNDDAQAPFPPHFAPSTDLTTTVKPTPLFLIAGGSMVVSVSLFKLAVTL